MVTQYGMTERLGAIKFGGDNTEPFLGREMSHPRDYSEEVAALVDEEVKKLIETAHNEAWEILVENRDVLDNLVLQLLEKETLNKEQIAEVFAPIVKRPPAAGLDRLLPSYAVDPSAGALPQGARTDERCRTARRRRSPPRRPPRRSPPRWPSGTRGAPGELTPRSCPGGLTRPGMDAAPPRF